MRFTVFGSFALGYKRVEIKFGINDFTKYSLDDVAGVFEGFEAIIHSDTVEIPIYTKPGLERVKYLYKIGKQYGFRTVRTSDLDSARGTVNNLIKQLFVYRDLNERETILINNLYETLSYPIFCRRLENLLIYLRIAIDNACVMSHDSEPSKSDEDSPCCIIDEVDDEDTPETVYHPRTAYQVWADVSRGIHVRRPPHIKTARKGLIFRRSSSCPLRVTGPCDIDDNFVYLYTATHLFTVAKASGDWGCCRAGDGRYTLEAHERYRSRCTEIRTLTLS